MAKYFDVSEMVCHCCGQLPPDGIDTRLQNVCDAIREQVGAPVVASCFYRCPSHNAEVGGVQNGCLDRGCAADLLTPDGWDVDSFASLAKSCGADGIGLYPWGIHVDTRGYEATWDYR